MLLVAFTALLALTQTEIEASPQSMFESHTQPAPRSRAQARARSQGQTQAQALSNARAQNQSHSRQPRLISYNEAVICAGLTQAASELEGGESRYGRQLYDVALYWSLAAIQAATTAGRSPIAAEEDQTRSRLNSVQRLSAGETEARSRLQRCRQTAPRLG